MLEFGTRPVTAGVQRARFVAEIDAILKPFLDPDDSPADPQERLGQAEVAGTC